MDVGLTVLLGIAVYFVGLSLVAWWANRHRPGPGIRSAAYGLSLATFGTAWTYFAGIGNATLGNWSGIANAIGPVVASTIGLPVWYRIARRVKQENTGSLSDFLAVRYGKSLAVGVLATLVSIASALLYLALQLKLLTEVIVYFSGSPRWGASASFVMMAALVAMAILVGARKPNLTEYNRGFVHMIAIDSIIKLVGLVTAAATLIWLLGFANFAETMSLDPLITSQRFDFTFIVFTLLCITATFTLPRQFHLSFVMVERLEDIRSLWIYPVYFVVWILCIYLISEAIRGGLAMPGVDARMQVLAIPYMHGWLLATVIIVLGGVSAGAGMVIVELTAISSMISNELILPIMTRFWSQTRDRRNASQDVTRIRRASMVAFGLAAWLVYLRLGTPLHPFNLAIIALTLSAQLAPALLAGLYWRRANELGAIAGILAGLFAWVLIASSGPLLHLPLIDTIWPHHRELTFSFSALASLVINALVFVVVSLHARPRLIDSIQAEGFVGHSRESPVHLSSLTHATVGDMRRLLTQLLGDEEARRALLEFEVSMHIGGLGDDSLVTPTLVLTAERILAGVIGAPSARNVIALTLAADRQDAASIGRLLDEAGLAIIFSRELLLRTLESLEEGVGVVDNELRLVAWNSNYLNLVDLSLEEVHVGQSLQHLLTDRGVKGGNSPVRALLRERMDHIAEGTPLQAEIPLGDGRIYRLFGTRIAGHGYLMTFTDVTDMRRAAMVLSRSNEELERSVRDRTQELIALNDQLLKANVLAEQASHAQRRFVAAASHDLVQPLHAARLFIGTALAESGPEGSLTPLLQRADIAIEGAHRLMRALLNLSKLEMGAAKPKVAPVDLGSFLEAIADEFRGQADAAGLELICLPTRLRCITDRDLLRSMLQNLIANAIRYTETGRVVLMARRAGENVRIEIRDSGVGMAPEAMERAFREFERLNEGQRMADGTGLGLSIVARIAEVLGHKVSVRSMPDKGSTFAVSVPITDSPERRVRTRIVPADLKGLRVLCVDDEREVLAGTAALVTRWGGAVTTAPSAERALQLAEQWDVVIADYLLGDGMDGLELLRRMAARCSARILITATAGSLPEEALLREGVRIMEKPLSPMALQTMLVDFAGRRGVQVLQDSASN
ncbi:PAS-domain containing protein [Novosphingobium flavum]|uniref:histidine kinase n=1 Tax=Novosphingobium flavum TaxID=1778672 RepID=A0A7X1KM04_9SPHN|nr:ATP-binding protein [Novosphingobium flavum]MBC2666117.1 PAS-domain containing protein [Novosphingobium flavum]